MQRAGRPSSSQRIPKDKDNEEREPLKNPPSGKQQIRAARDNIPQGRKNAERKGGFEPRNELQDLDSSEEIKIRKLNVALNQTLSDARFNNKNYANFDDADFVAVVVETFQFLAYDPANEVFIARESSQSDKASSFESHEIKKSRTNNDGEETTPRSEEGGEAKSASLTSEEAWPAPKARKLSEKQPVKRKTANAEPPSPGYIPNEYGRSPTQRFLNDIKIKYGSRGLKVARDDIQFGMLKVGGDRTQESSSYRTPMTFKAGREIDEINANAIKLDVIYTLEEEQKQRASRNRNKGHTKLNEHTKEMKNNNIKLEKLTKAFPWQPRDPYDIFVSTFSSSLSEPVKTSSLIADNLVSYVKTETDEAVTTAGMDEDFAKLAMGLRWLWRHEDLIGAAMDYPMIELALRDYQRAPPGHPPRPAPPLDALKHMSFQILSVIDTNINALAEIVSGYQNLRDPNTKSDVSAIAQQHGAALVDFLKKTQDDILQFLTFFYSALYKLQERKDRSGHQIDVTIMEIIKEIILNLQNVGSGLPPRAGGALDAAIRFAWGVAEKPESALKEAAELLKKRPRGS